MTIDVEDALARLAAVPAPPGLNAIEADVLDRIARVPAGIAVGIGSGAGLLGIVVALGLGMAGAGIPAGPARAAPFGMGGAPTPATLLAGE